MKALLVLSLVFSTAFFSLKCEASTPDFFDLEKVVGSSVQYLIDSQIKENTHSASMSGEWKNYIYLNGISLGKRKSGSQFLDSNSFVTSSTYELLSEIYDTNPEKYSKLIDSMNLAVEGLSRYESNGTFNFWPNLASTTSDNKIIRGPIYFPLRNSLERNFVNIVNDSDDTALAFRALKKQEQYGLKDNRFNSPFLIPIEMEKVFDKHLDLERDKSHYYNNRMGDPKNSGAFLTWFGSEEVSGPKSLVSWLPLEKKPAIPFNVNDVDCVANANVLATLAIDDSLEKSKGAENSCRYINNSFLNGRSKRCGSYYPSEFVFHYTASKAFNAGAKCLKDSLEIIKREIFAAQNKDGSFVSPWHKNESIQATAYALSSLINIHKADKGSPKVKMAIEDAITYLLSQKKYDSQGNIFWKGGAFFSGGSIIRKKILWISDAYTTALIAAAMNAYLEEIK